ncbi:DUF6178 family protein [Desulfococcus sp.]|uniref:DUF6178 family protein n=1 Tax=Desulfococcus sp. TaxID=2025834 RepID=UPI0035936E81
MNETKPAKTMETRLRELAESRSRVLYLPPEKARDAILESPQPAALVHAIQEEDFYFLIHDIGVEDALDLLRLASARQWEFLLDMSVWEKDRISLSAWTRWLHLLMKADPERLVNWISEERLEEMEYYLFRNVQLAVREHDQDPSDFGDGFHTYDDTFYVRFNDALYDPERDAELQAERDAFLDEFLRRLAADDHIVYYNLLLESRSVVPAEIEEEAYRLRNIRMAEKGHKPFYEAIGIYQPLPADESDRGRRPPGTGRQQNEAAPPPLFPYSVIEKDSLFAEGLARIDQTSEIELLQAEFAGLCNHIISADQRVIREKDALKPVVKKACGYVSIGLEALAGRQEIPPDQAALMIRRYPLERIFRVGYGKALELKWRAEKWRKASWAEHEGLSLSFWGEEWLGVIGGLLVERPLFFDNYRSGVLYREFHAMADIAATDAVLARVVALDELFGLMDALPPLPRRRLLTWKSLLLTLWARRATGYEGEAFALPVPVFRPFFDDLWEGPLPSRKISDAAKGRFLAWLARAARLEAHALSRKFQTTLEQLFETVETEYQGVSAAHLDARHVHLFMLA